MLKPANHIRIKGDNIPVMYMKNSKDITAASLTSSPCLRQDCLTFMAFIRNYKIREYEFIYNTLTSQQKPV